MGFLDLPRPLLDFVDSAVLGALPPLVRLILWAVVAAILSLAIYRWLSPQRRIADVKAAALAARRRLNAHDGDLESALPLMRQSMALALRHVGLVLPAALVASLPVLALLVWLDGAYGPVLPAAGQTPAIQVEPQGYGAQWQADGNGARIALTDPQGAQVAQLSLERPATRIEKRHWWNTVVGSPGGYLPADGPVAGVTIALPERQYIPIGPEWLRSWFVVAFGVLLITSILFMRVARIA
ncbi:MAG TPA: hypothetical protein VGF43_16490 [Dongiaceae bacterium]